MRFYPHLRLVRPEGRPQYRKIIAATSTAAVSAGLAISWESLQGVSQTNVPAAESLQGISQSSVPPWDAGEGIDQSIGVPWESSQSISQSSTPASENGQGISGALGVPIEFLLGIRQSNLPSWAFEGTISSSVGVPWTSEGTVVSSTETPIENLLGVAQSNIPPAEFLQGLHPESGIFWEARGPVFSDGVIFWEVVRTPVAANVPPISVEILRGLHPDPEIFWESRGPITSSAGHAYEWLHFIQQTQSDAAEHLKEEVQTLAPFWEARGFVFSSAAGGTVFWESLSKPVEQTASIEWESLQGLQPGASPLWEALQGLHKTGSVFWDSRGLLTVAVGPIIEWLLTVKSGGGTGPSAAPNYAVDLEQASASYISLASQFPAIQDFTFEGWIKVESLDPGGHPKFVVSSATEESAPPAGDGWNVNVGSDGKLAFSVQGASVQSTVFSDAALTFGVWYHFAVSHDSVADQIRMYIGEDACPDAEVSTSPVAHSDGIQYDGGRPFSFGRQNKAFSQSSRYFDGAIDEFRAWSAVRSLAAINADKLTRLTGSETNLIGYWDMDEGSGSTVADQSPSANTGTLQGGAVFTSNYDAAPILIGGGDIAIADDGLLLRDSFGGGDTPTPPGWTETVTANWSIVSGVLQAINGTFSAIYRSDSGHHSIDNFVVQVNAKRGSANSWHGIILCRASSFGVPREGDPDAASYILYHIGGSTEIRLYTQATQYLSVFQAAYATGVWNTYRLLFTKSGVNMIAEFLDAQSLAVSSDLSKDLTSRGTTAAMPLGTGTILGTNSENSLSERDEYLVFKGDAITMTGLPSGYKVQVGSRTPVTEVGGTVTIPASTWKTWAFPACCIKVLDSSGAPVAALSPPNGFYGGASFSFTPASTVGQIEWESLTGLEPDFTVPIEILSGPRKTLVTPYERLRGLHPDRATPWESRGPVAPASVEVPWESLLSVSQEEVVDWASIGSVSNEQEVNWAAEGKVFSPRDLPWESQQILYQPTLTPWESLLSVLSAVNCPWESNQTLRRASSPLYERLRGRSRTQTAPWEATGRIVASEAIFVEMLLGLHPEISPPWEAGGRVANLVVPFWESRGPVVNVVIVPYEWTQGNIATSVETLYEILLGVRNEEEILYEVLPGLGAIVGPTVTIKRRDVIRPTRAGLPFPEPAVYDPVTGLYHDPELAIIGPPEPVSAAVEIPWESTEELIDTSIEYINASLAVFGSTILFNDVPGKKIRVVSYVATRAAGTPSVRIRFREATAGPIIFEIGPLGNGIIFAGSSDLPAFETAAGAELVADLAGGVPFQNVFIHMAIVRV